MAKKIKRTLFTMLVFSIAIAGLMLSSCSDSSSLDEPTTITTDADAVAEDKANLGISFAGTDTATSVTGNLALPTSGANGTTITWASSNTSVIATNGTVTRPSGGDTTVTLTATITKGSVSDTITFTLTVKQAAATDADAVAEDKANLKITFAGLDTATSVTGNLTLPTSGSNGTTITWASSNTSVIATNGTVTRPSGSNAAVTLTATISKGSASDTKTFTLTVIAGTYTVTFDSQGGSAVTPQTVNSGATATTPADPTKTSYTFGGWYTESACTTAWNFSTPITADRTLYAKWTGIPSDYIFRWRLENNGTDAKGTLNLNNSTGSPAYSTSSPHEGSHYLSVDGSSHIYSSGSFDVTSNTISIAGWFYIDSDHSGSNPAAVGLGEIRIYYSSGEIRGETSNGLYAQTSISYNTWYHVVFTWDGSNERIYLDGDSTPKEIYGASDDITTVNAQLYIGSKAGSDYWKGYIDDVIIYDRVLSGTEVSTIYNSY